MFSEKIVKTWILGLSAHPPILFLIKMKLVIYNKYFYTSNFKWITGMILLIKYQHLMDIVEKALLHAQSPHFTRDCS